MKSAEKGKDHKKSGKYKKKEKEKFIKRDEKYRRKGREKKEKKQHKYKGNLKRTEFYFSALFSFFFFLSSFFFYSFFFPFFLRQRYDEYVKKAMRKMVAAHTIAIVVLERRPVGRIAVFVLVNTIVSGAT